MSLDTVKHKRLSQKKKERLLTGAMVVIEPPDTLYGQERDYWAQLIQARPSYDWLPPDLLRLHRLCQLMSMSETYYLETLRHPEDEAEILKMMLSVERVIMMQCKALHLHISPFKDSSIVEDVAQLREDPEDPKEKGGDGMDMLG